MIFLVSLLPTAHLFILICFFTIMIVVVNVVAETDTKGAS